MISVIIPIYNKSNYIIKCLDSVVNQTFNCFEIIIIDDGSTDNSLEFIEKYNFKDINSKIISQVNSGVSTTRNNGVKLAKYDYIAYLDADDWWEPNFLQEMVKLIKSFPDAGLYATSYFKIKNNKKVPAIINIEEKFNVGYIDYIKLYSINLWMPIWTGATVVKKEVIEELNGFKPNLKLGEDFDLWLRISQTHKIAFLNIPLSNYNQDVEQQNRAIGYKFYLPEEHVLFQNFGELMKNINFKILFEKLFLYSMQPYYIYGKNLNEIKEIFSTIDFNLYPFKYKLIYKICPRFFLKIWLRFMRLGSIIKKYIR